MKKLNGTRREYFVWTVAAVFCAAMVLFVCKENPGNNNCDVNPAATKGCPGYDSCAANPSLCVPQQAGENDIYTLTLNAGAGGKVSKNPNKEKYAEGETVRISATPDDGYNFDKWENDASGSQNPQTITMNGNKSIIARFTSKNTQPTKYTITLNPGTGGQISKNPNKSEYDAGESVTITAQPENGYTFTAWSGDLSGTDISKSISMTKNYIIGAAFTVSSNPPQGGGDEDGPFTLTININPADGGSAEPTSPKPAEGEEGPVWGPYVKGAIVIVSWRENSGYEFDDWSGAGTNTGALDNRRVTMNSDQTITANFIKLSQGGGGTQKYSVTLDIVTNEAKKSGKCTVTQTKGGLGIESYDAGSSVTVTAQGSAPFVFQGWRERGEAIDASTNSSYTFTINKHWDLVARFIDTTTAAQVKYCRWEGSSSNCWQINPNSTDPSVTKSEEECKAKNGEVVIGFEGCSAPSNGVYCSYPASKDEPASCSWRSGTSVSAASTACTTDKGTVVSSCP